MGSIEAQSQDMQSRDMQSRDIPSREPSASSHAEAPTLCAAIEHTLLRADATSSDISALCREARAWGFFAVCVHGRHVSQCAHELSGSNVRTVSVVGFPLGAGTTASKVFEAEDAIRCGASEIDMVIPLGALRQRDYGAVVRDVQAIAQAIAPSPLKAIVETGALSVGEIRVAASLAQAGGAAFVKTSTGFGPRGASVDDVQLIRSVVAESIQIKASGGIKTAAAARALLAAGASRIGTSRGVELVEGESTCP